LLDGAAEDRSVDVFLHPVAFDQDGNEKVGMKLGLITDILEHVADDYDLIDALGLKAIKRRSQVLNVFMDVSDEAEFYRWHIFR
jgi:hypothetical protein